MRRTWAGLALGSFAIAAAAGIPAAAWAGAADAPTVRIAFPSGMNAQIIVAMDKAGVAEKVGLKAEYASFPYGPPMMEALAAGSIDVVVTSLMPVTSYAAKLPGDVKIVSMVGNSSHSLMVGKDSPIGATDGLVGKSIGVSFGSDSHLDTLVWLRQNGLAGKVELVNIAPPELVTALSNRSVDAVVIRQPQVLRLQQQAGARVLHTWPFHFVSIVKTRFISEHPAEFQRYLIALREAIFFVAQHHEQSAGWFGEYLKMDPAIVRQVSGDDPNYNVASIGEIDLSITLEARDLIATWVDHAYQEKMIKRKVDLGALLQ